MASRLLWSGGQRIPDLGACGQVFSGLRWSQQLYGIQRHESGLVSTFATSPHAQLCQRTITAAELAPASC